MSIPGHIFALLPAGTWIKDEFLHCNVLYFSMRGVQFIAITDCNKPAELLAIREAITKATKFECDSKLIKAVDYNMSIEQFEDRMAEFANEEWMAE